MLNGHFHLETYFCLTSAGRMSTGFVNLQAQVESLLGGLVKAASVELVKLFESKYHTSVLDAGLAQDNKGNETTKLDPSLWFEDTKRSIGIQVEENFCSPLELSESSFLSDCDCLGDPNAVLEQEGLIPGDIILAEDNGHADPEWLSLNDQIVADTLSMVDLSVLEVKSTTDNTVLSEVVLDETPKCESTCSSPSKNVLVMPPDTSGDTCGETVKFVCPLIVKVDSLAPEPDILVKSEQVESQLTCISPPKGTAHSPSYCDGAGTPSEDEKWEIPSLKETKNQSPVKVKPSHLPNQKLLSSCRVQLVDMLTLPESEAKTQEAVAKVCDSFSKSGWPLPKDFRHHQGSHTGHRLCCFTQCVGGVWRLNEAVTYSRESYMCNICGKAFRRRKVLRRHERFHTGEKPYPCSLCSKTFALKKSLRRHVRFHTGERPHICMECGKSFRLRENLKAHSRFHTGEKPFSCTLCGKTFRILRNLEKHKLSVCNFFVPSFRTIAGIKRKNIANQSQQVANGCGSFNSTTSN